MDKENIKILSDKIKLDAGHSEKAIGLKVSIFHKIGPCGHFYKP